MTEIVIRLEGTPVPLARARHGNGRVYADSKSAAHQKSLGWAARAVMLGRPPLTGPIEVELVFAFPWPKRTPQSKRIEGALHTSKPDLDNCIKQLDGLNEIVWADDRQAASISARKVYSASPSTTVIVRSVGE